MHAFDTFVFSNNNDHHDIAPPSSLMALLDDQDYDQDYDVLAGVREDIQDQVPLFTYPEIDADFEKACFDHDIAQPSSLMDDQDYDVLAGVREDSQDQVPSSAVQNNDENNGHQSLFNYHQEIEKACLLGTDQHNNSSNKRKHSEVSSSGDDDEGKKKKVDDVPSFVAYPDVLGCEEMPFMRLDGRNTYLCIENPSTCHSLCFQILTKPRRGSHQLFSNTTFTPVGYLYIPTEGESMINLHGKLDRQFIMKELGLGADRTVEIWFRLEENSTNYYSLLTKKTDNHVVHNTIEFSGTSFVRTKQEDMTGRKVSTTNVQVYSHLTNSEMEELLSE